MTMLKTMRGSMFTGFKKQPWFIALVFLVATTTTLAQALPPGVSPAMLSQLKSMSPAQQQALAKQYGIALPAGNTGSGDFVGLASPGAALPSAMDMTQADVDAAAPDKTEEVQTRARTRYGRALFNRDVSTFAPTDDAPVPESYRLGVGDQLIVQLFGKENEQLSLQVGRSGDVSFPKLGSITLSGLTFEDARDLIKTRVAQQLIGVEAVVSMGRLRAINVFMAGEVSVPGAYSVSAMTTVTQALFQAGGVTDIGTLRHIQVRRGGGVVAAFDTYDLLMRGDVSNDIRLQSGERGRELSEVVLVAAPVQGLVADDVLERLGGHGPLHRVPRGEVRVQPEEPHPEVLARQRLHLTAGVAEVPGEPVHARVDVTRGAGDVAEARALVRAVEVLAPALDGQRRRVVQRHPRRLREDQHR